MAKASRLTIHYAPANISFSFVEKEKALVERNLPFRLEWEPLGPSRPSRRIVEWGRFLFTEDPLLFRPSRLHAMGASFAEVYRLFVESGRVRASFGRGDFPSLRKPLLVLDLDYTLIGSREAFQELYHRVAAAFRAKGIPDFSQVRAGKPHHLSWEAYYNYLWQDVLSWEGLKDYILSEKGSTAELAAFLQRLQDKATLALITGGPSVYVGRVKETLEGEGIPLFDSFHIIATAEVFSTKVEALSTILSFFYPQKRPKVVVMDDMACCYRNPSFPLQLHQVEGPQDTLEHLCHIFKQPF